MTLQPEARSFESPLVEPQMRPLAVVTGGSTGIGFELARQFAQNGFDLVIAAEHPGHLREAAQALTGLGEAGLSQVETVAVDLATDEVIRIRPRPRATMSFPNSFTRCTTCLMFRSIIRSSSESSVSRTKSPPTPTPALAASASTGRPSDTT